MPERMRADDDLNLNIGEPDDEKEKKKISPKQGLILFLVVLMVVGAVVAFLLLNKTAETETHTAPVEQALEIKPIKPRGAKVFSLIVHLGSFEVQLGDLGGDRAFKVGIELDVDSPALDREIIQRASQINTTVKTLLGAKTFNEIQSVEGKIILKNELIANLNRMLETGKVRNIYFSEFIIF